MPGGPHSIKLGTLPSAATARRRINVSSLPTTSSSERGRYFSTQGIPCCCCCCCCFDILVMALRLDPAIEGDRDDAAAAAAAMVHVHVMIDLVLVTNSNITPNQQNFDGQARAGVYLV